MIIFIAVNTVFNLALFFEEGIKLIGEKYLTNLCCKICKKYAKKIEEKEKDQSCSDFYDELKLQFLLVEYQRTRIQHNTYGKYLNNNTYPDSKRNIKNLRDFLANKIDHLQTKIRVFY